MKYLKIKKGHDHLFVIFDERFEKGESFSKTYFDIQNKLCASTWYGCSVISFFDSGALSIKKPFGNGLGPLVEELI